MLAVLLLPAGCKGPAADHHPPVSAKPTPAVPPTQDRPLTSIPPEQSPKSRPPSNEKPATAENRNLAGGHAPPRESAVPSPVPSFSPPTDDELIEQSLTSLKKGNLAYNTPEKMKSGSTAHITARIASNKISVQTLESGMPAEQGTKTEIELTPVSTKMRMTLKGADFDITPLSSEEQIVAGDSPTEWEWDVIPKHAGTLRLHLAAIVELKNLSRDFTTVDRDIAVQVDPVDAVTKFVETNAAWILGSIGAGLTALWAWWKKRKTSKTSSSQTA
jgi:hypothetical protein